MSDVFLHRSAEQGGNAASSPVLHADVDAAAAPGVLALLRRYRLRASVDVDDEGAAWTVCAAAADHPAAAAWPPDARGVAALGRRAIVPASAAALAESGGGADAYRVGRYRAGVPEGADLDPGRGTPLESCLDGLAAVSYTKGCYVGQEPVARAHFRGEVRKRVFPVVLAPPPPSSSSSPWPPPVGTSLAPRPGSSRPAGRLVAVDAAAGVGLALLRLDAALPAAAAGSALPFEGGDGAGGLVPSVPAWWPGEWAEAPAG